MHFCVAVHAVLSTSADVCVVIKHTIIDRANCCRDGIVIICTEAGGWRTIVACTNVLISTAVTDIACTAVLVSTVIQIMYTCVAVHAVLSTSADV